MPSFRSVNLVVCSGIESLNTKFRRVKELYPRVSVKQSFCVFPRLKKMEGLDITDMRVEPCVESRFIKTSRVVFKQVGHDANLRFGKISA